MNLFVRLLYVLLSSFFRPRLPVGPATSELSLLTFPNDLDLNLHVNNGRYLTLCDLNRVDLFIRSGLARIMLQRGWMPIITEHTMNYRKSLGVFQRFTATLHLTHWDERHFYMTHHFTIKDKIIAEGTSKGVLKGKHGVVAPAEVIAALLEAQATAPAK
ncbi:thioesterase family protein [Rugamonas sp. CCM 8940]|uniref:thioesterase family protein n=1 Tax=Rugamonas sp. CCM 8940 TaxID=2765359 RepID=UPI0018F3D394|nr:thioesterase family protein [Rugamonas sp. CCM 8940]MBJ7312795.1 thioesterase family protein [Rugamonas sp. CCM 8940]